jgi:predicted nucleotidyltransferase
MNVVDLNQALSIQPVLPDHPLLLWMNQIYRKLLGKPMLQKEVLGAVVAQARKDQNVVGILLFGSLATGTHTWKSDIDLIIVYQACQPESGVANILIDRVIVQYFFTSIDTLLENVENVPYLLHFFCRAKILFDRHGTFSPLVTRVEDYFSAHPEIEEEWVRIEALHQEEKNGPACAQTTILQRWDQLEEKYSGGTRRRTFFREQPIS